MEQKCSTDPMANNHNSVGIVRSLRSIPPSHYTLKINSFSFFVNKKIEYYESGVFEAGGHKWKLCLYPNGNKKKNVTDHISLYLEIVDTESFSLYREVNVCFKFFVFDHILEKYLSFDEGGIIRRFYWMRTQWGFDKFLPLSTFNDAANGYLVDDGCLFGAEVFVAKSNGKGECLSLIQDPANNTFTCKFEYTPLINEECRTSQQFCIGAHYWTLKFYPRGYGTSKRGSVSLLLEIIDGSGCLASGRKLYAAYNLQIKNQQVDGIYSEHQGEHWFCDSSKICGFFDFMTWRDLHDKSNGFLVNNAVIVRVQITQIFSIKDF